MLRVLVALFLGYIVLRCSSVMNDVEANRAAASAATKAPEAAPSGVLSQVVHAEPQWERASFPDELSGKPYTVVSVKSANAHDFQFPYNGGTVAALLVRRHPRHGVDVIFSITKGQLTCDYRNCRVGWRVDDKTIRYPEAIKPVDGSADTFFLSGNSQLIKDLKGAKRLVIQTSVYQEGERSWEFNVADFAAP